MWARSAIHIPIVASWPNASLKAHPLHDGFLFRGRQAAVRESRSRRDSTSDDVLSPADYAAGCPRHIQVQSVIKGLAALRVKVICSSSAGVS